MYYILNDRIYIAKYVIFIIIKKYYIIHKYTQMHMDNDIKFRNEEDENENALNYLIVKL